MSHFSNLDVIFSRYILIAPLLLSLLLNGLPLSLSVALLSTAMPNIKWRGSIAQKVMLDHLNAGTLPLDEIKMTAEEAWKIYRDKDGFTNAGVGFQQFKRQLAAHREQVVKKLAKASMPKQQQKKPQQKTGEKSTDFKSSYKIDWRKSHARIVLLEDLESGVLPLEESELSVKEAWALYKNEDGFKNLVEFGQFKKQLEAHREQVSKKKNKSSFEEKALDHDLTVRKRSKYNRRGELKFDYHPAKLLLRADVKNGVHKTLGLGQLWKKHAEYQAFLKRKFSERLRQEVRRSKFVYYMNRKREKKLEAAEEAKVEAKAKIEKEQKKKEKEIARKSAQQNGKRLRSV